MIRVTMRLRGGGVACFGIIVAPDENGVWRVTEAAPIAAWSKGRWARNVWSHYERQRGAKVEWLPPTP